MQMEKIEVSVVLPCLNEEDGIGACIDKIRDLFRREGLSGEIIVSDNGSTDRSASIAAEKGAIVVTEPKRGYGAAYLRGIKEARGRYVIMGDSDNTYDFNDIPKFVGKLKEGHDLVMGSRFKGKIQKGAMSWSHRYIGNPILSSLTRLFFRTGLSDIHCGMRAFTLEAFQKMKLRTVGMEFATEMVVAALQNNLKISEVAIEYYPREGESKLKPVHDAWRHFRFMLLYCPVWLYFIPGTLGLFAGMVLLLLGLRGPFLFLGHYWDLHLMIVASMATVLSYQVLNLGIYAHTFAIREGFLRLDAFTVFFGRSFNLEKGIFLGMALFLTGFVIMLFIFIEWFVNYFGALYRIRETIFATTLLIIGLQTIFSSFFLSLLVMEKK